MKCLWALMTGGRSPYTTTPSWAELLAHYARRVRWWLSMPLLIAYRFTFLQRLSAVAVTGSLGKTMTGNLIGGVLAIGPRRGAPFRPNRNSPRALIRGLMRVAPWHGHMVQEVSAAYGAKRLQLELPLSLLAHKIGVVTSIGTDHWSVFGSAEAIAEEKSKLVSMLPLDGLAVLNADDPRVLAMRGMTRARVVTVGTGADADLRAFNIASRWPEPLRFDFTCDGRTHRVKTRLHGEHWAISILMAIAVGREFGIAPEDAIAAIGRVPPRAKRMEPVRRADGVDFIRDDQKATLKSFDPAIKALGDAEAKRKIAIIGTIADFPGSPRRAYRDVAAAARAVCDEVIFIGMHARHALRARQGPNDETIKAFVSPDAASPYIAQLLRPGDLVLLKGSRGVDQFGVYLELPTEDDLRAPVSHGLSPVREDIGDQGTDYGGVRAIIGLGNGAPRLDGTRHNVGHIILDALARSLDAEWEDTTDAKIATVSVGDRPIHLIKMMGVVNRSGPLISRLGNEFGFAADEVLVVLDDIFLQFGKTKTRIRGSAGGHNGMLSILETAGTDHIRRLKIGIGRPSSQDMLSAHVLGKFTDAEKAQLGVVAEEATRKIREFLKF